MSRDQHHLLKPQTLDEWAQYHAIRRRVLWERRGLYGVYDENHPDEYKSAHHPFLLIYRGVAIGVIRIDIDGKQAIFRRVAVREDVQRSGHGRVLLELSEEFAREKDCDHLYSFVSPDAVEFYEKCGFRRDAGNPKYADDVPMEKRLSVMHRSHDMEINAPSFRLRKQRCPCFCGGEGFLAFITCPGCRHVALVCDEVGTVFPDPRDLTRPSYGSWLDMSGSEDDRCPQCKTVQLAMFRHSTGEEIQAIGFLPSEYQ